MNSTIVVEMTSTVDPNETYQVNLLLNTCTCDRFNYLGIPYPHLFAAWNFSYKNLEVETLNVTNKHWRIDISESLSQNPQLISPKSNHTQTMAVSVIEQKKTQSSAQRVEPISSIPPCKQVPEESKSSSFSKKNHDPPLSSNKHQTSTTSIKTSQSNCTSNSTAMASTKGEFQRPPNKLMIKKMKLMTAIAYLESMR